MLFYLRVGFATTDGQMEVLIEEMHEMNVDGHRFVFIGRIASGEGRLRILNKERQARNRRGV
jgi:hypothetical protein